MRKAVFVLLLVVLLALSTGVSFAGFANGDPGCGEGANLNPPANWRANGGNGQGGLDRAAAHSAC